MKEDTESKKALDSYITDLKERQSNLVWPYVLRNDRSVDELLWKGARGDPLVQRIGVAILALAYVMVALVLVSLAVEQGSWIGGVLAALLFGVGGWFIRNAFMK